MTWLVVGLGNPDRGDDAVGPVVAAGIAGLGLPCVDVIAHEDPTCLLDAWSEHSAVVVVDAVCSGAAPGTVVAIETGGHDGPAMGQAWDRTGRGGTHAFGLATAIELARALGRMPERLVLVGVEVGCVEHGAGLSPAVRSALGRVQEVVVGLVAQAPPVAVTVPHGTGARTHVPR